MKFTYELHRHPEPDFPVIFHLDVISPGREIGDLHWHEGIELLYCIDGAGTVVSDDERIPMLPGDIVIVNSGRLHTVYSAAGCRYYCLITAPELLAANGLPAAETTLRALVQDDAARGAMDAVIGEMLERRPYYRTAVRSSILGLYTHLYRHFAQAQPPQSDGHGSHLLLVKAVLSYIRHHFSQPLSLSGICAHIGFSRYYTCHVFKQLTGQTIVSYLNYVRCANAKSLLLSGRCNIGESAGLSGYTNLSYFSRTYKEIHGETPSATHGRAVAKNAVARPAGTLEEKAPRPMVPAT